VTTARLIHVKHRDTGGNFFPISPLFVLYFDDLSPPLRNRLWRSLSNFRQYNETRNMTKHKWYIGLTTNRRALLLGVLLVVAAALLLNSQRAITVQVAVLESDVPITVFGLGTVEARVLSEIGFEVGATLIELNADHGDRVSEGAVLARLSNGEQQARVAKAQAGVTNGEAAMNMAQTVVDQARTVLAQRQQTNRRLQRLRAQNTVSEEAAEDAQLQQDVATAELAVALSEVEVAQARMADARAQLDYDNVLLDQHVLTAPYGAIVVKRHRELGSVLNAGEPVFTLVDAATVWVLAYVDESLAGDIRVGQPVEIRLRSLPRTVISGQVARIDIESDRVNEERRVYVVCNQCPGSFHLGEQAEVLITTTELEQALLIPETAAEAFDGADGKIWVVIDGKLQLLNVQFGAKTLDGRLVIITNLPDGAQPVTEWHKGLSEGRRAKAATQVVP
jgi:HlyD family secretion protein